MELFRKSGDNSIKKCVFLRSKRIKQCCSSQDRFLVNRLYRKIAVLQFHGVPDTAHDWVSTKQEKFAAFMQWPSVEM